MYTAPLGGKVVVIASLPRTGTHFVIDFMRKNFVTLDVSLPVWRSSERLYINLDRLVNGGSWIMSSATRSSFLVKTHELPFSHEGQTLLKDLVRSRKVHIFTPVRPYKSFIESYSRYLNYSTGRSVSFKGEDPYYRDGRTTKQIVEDFLNWCEIHSTFIDVEKAVRSPEDLANQIGEMIEETPRDIERRLPDRRQSNGRLDEILIRLKGRESSEVIMPKSADLFIPHLPTDLEKRIESVRQNALPYSN